MQIKFQDYIDATKAFQETVDANCKAYSQYLRVMAEISENAMMSGTAADTLKYVLSQLDRARYIPEGIPKSLTNQVNQFLDDLHTAQIVDGESILYDKDFEGYRDYSDHMFACLQGAVESTDYQDGINALFDFLEDSIMYALARITGKCDLSSSQDLRQAQSNLLQYKDVTLQRLLGIRDNINGIFERYTGYFQGIADTMTVLNDYLSQMADIFDCYSTTGAGVTEEQKSAISTLFDSMVSHYEDVQVGNESSTDEIEKFLDDGANLNGPWRFHFHNITNYILHRPIPEFFSFDLWKTSIFQFFNIPQMLITGLGDVEKVLLKNNILETLEEISDSYDYEDSFMHEGGEAISTILECIELYGDQWEEFYPGDKRRKEFRHAKEFFSNIDDLDDILNEIDGAAEILTKLFSDYSYNLYLLESLERNYEADESLKAALREIRELYEKNALAIIGEITYEKLVEEGLDYLYTLSFGSIFTAIKIPLEIIGKITGEDERTLTWLEFEFFGEDLLVMSDYAFRNAVAKLKNADPSDPLYTQYVADVKNTFLVYKETLSRMYEKMALVTEGDESSYYSYCAKQVENMRITDVDETNLLTFEEYKSKPAQVYGRD